MEREESSTLSRRDFLALAAAAAGMILLPGCDPASQVASGTASGASARSVEAVAYASPAPVPVAAPATRYVYVQQPAPQPQPAPSLVVPANPGRLTAMSRTTWGAMPAIPTKMRPMNGVTRITIHHEGSAKPNNDSSPAQVAATLRLIQSQHRKRMSAGDIGYHFIIDRTGVIWQGRDWAFQGAHASGANSNNIGVMLLGNFEIQQPTAQQLASLKLITASLIRKYGLNPARDIYGHADFCNTQCPGKNLKPHVAAMRRSLR